MRRSTRYVTSSSAALALLFVEIGCWSSPTSSPTEAPTKPSTAAPGEMAERTLRGDAPFDLAFPTQTPPRRDAATNALLSACRARHPWCWLLLHVATSEKALEVGLADVPRYVNVAVTYTSSWREISCTEPSNPEPETFFDLELDQARVHEAELSMWVLTTELGVALHRCAPVGTDVYHRNSIEYALVVLGVRVKSLDHKPVIGMCSTHVFPAHTSRVSTGPDSEQLLDEAAGILTAHSVLDGQTRGSADQLPDDRCCKRPQERVNE